VEDREIFLFGALLIQLLAQGREGFQPTAAEPETMRLRPPAAGMEFAVVEGESFSPSCPTLIMVRNPNAARYPRLLLESSF